MLPIVDLARIETALGSWPGWLELAIVVACFIVGWLLERRVRLKSVAEEGFARIGLDGLIRLLLPLAALVLLFAASTVFRRWQPPFFLSIAIPLAIALALIRLLIYTLRALFGKPPWLPVSERVIELTIWLVVLLHFIGVLPELRAELDAITLPIGSKHVSVLELLKGAVVVIVTIGVTLWLSELIEQRVQNASNLDSSVRAVLSKVVRAVLIVIGVLIALQAVGFDLTLLTVFGGALGVGIGLGLQKLASNYIAGFTILLDRSIRLGDRITVDNRFGVVAKVTSRYVVLRGMEGIDAIVPNEILVTTTVLNHSYLNREIRIGLTVLVAHDSDVGLALELMEEAASSEPRVLGAPNAPKAFFARFTDLGMELELGVWISDPENGQLNLKSALNQKILQAFRANGIRLSSPPRPLPAADSGARAGGPADSANAVSSR